MDAEHHAIIYSGLDPIPFPEEKEKGLIKRSIQMKPDGSRHKLDAASRLNYANPIIFEYNVKVWFIGRLSSSSQRNFEVDYKRVHAALGILDVRPVEQSRGSLVDHAQGARYGLDHYPSGTAGSGSPHAVAQTYPSTAILYGLNYNQHEEISKYGFADVFKDPGDDLREPGDSDNRGDQRDGDGAGGQKN